MPLPTITDLQSIYGIGNPMAYGIARENAGLEQQIRQQQFQQESEQTRKAGLDNLFQSQNDPMKLEHQGLVNKGLGISNEGAGYDTQIKGVAARRAAANEWDNLQEDARKHLLSGTKADYDLLQAQAQKMMTSLNPEEQKEGQRIYGLSQHARERAEKWADETDKIGYTHTKRMEELKQSGANAESVARIGAENKINIKAMGAKPGGADFWTNYYKMRSAKVQHSALVAEARKIIKENPEEAEKMLAMAEDIRPQVEAEISSTKPGSVNVPAVAGLPANAGPQIAPPGAAKPAGPKPPVVGEIRQGYKFNGGNPADPKSWSKQ